jgi:NADPH2:quinone reductase
MKAIQVQKTGGPEVLTVVDLPIPKPKPNEAVVKITVSGINFIDVYFREGRYPSPLPLVDGQEAAGTVSEVGSDVKSVKAGDRVAYTGILGSYAEYAVVPADRLVHVPDKITDQQAAAAMLQGMTAHYLVHSTYPLKKGETALVHAAAGGVGGLLVQMGKQIGARIIATVGSEEKAKLAREAGADEVIVHPYFLGPGRHSRSDIPRTRPASCADCPRERSAHRARPKTARCSSSRPRARASFRIESLSDKCPHTFSAGSPRI